MMTAVEQFWQDILEILPSSVETNMGMKLLKAHDRAKEMEKQQTKDLVIGTYIDLKMKNNNLAFGMEYISELGKLEEEAEQYYKKTFKL
jgi:translation elongation factor EF-1beta